jgi:4-alpha-glucanotransferase
VLILLNQEELTKETEQQNLPGTTPEYPDWKRKMKLRLEELQGEEAAGIVKLFRTWLERTGRVNG